MRPAYLLPAPSPRQRPADVLDALASQLRQRGIGELIEQSCDRISVLSLPAVTVWTNGRVLWWRTMDGEITWSRRRYPSWTTPAGRRFVTRPGD